MIFSIHLIFTILHHFFTVNKFVEFINEDELIDIKDVPGTTLYTLKEIKNELRFLFRKGYSKITLTQKPEVNDKNQEVTHSLHVGENSLENMAQTKYLQLEYFE